LRCRHFKPTNSLVNPLLSKSLKFHLLSYFILYILLSGIVATPWHIGYSEVVDITLGYWLGLTNRRQARDWRAGGQIQLGCLATSVFWNCFSGSNYLYNYTSCQVCSFL
jgi:hypothetical protein